MKKICAALAFAIFTGIFNFCSADLLEHYQNHPDYKVYGGRQGSYVAVYLPSIHVEEYNPPHYQIGFNGIYITSGVVGVKDKVEWFYNDARRFNWYTKEFFYRDQNSGYWQKAETRNDVMFGKDNRRFADILFRAAYGMNFYGY